MYVQSIFYFAQSFEKGNKSVIACYQIKHELIDEIKVEDKLIKDFGHQHRKVVTKIIRMLVQSETELYLSRGGNQNDEFIVKPKKFLELFEGKREKGFDDDELIDSFRLIVKGEYNGIYKRYKNIFTNPVSRYSMLALMLSRYFENMESFARYPQHRFGFNNVKFLNIPENNEACKYLSDMISEFLVVIPLMWEKIIELK